MEVAPARRGKMDSTPGRSGDSHPRRLVEASRREEYVLPCPALAQSLYAGQVKILRELKKCANFFSFLVAPASSEDSKISDIHDIFSSVSFH